MYYSLCLAVGSICRVQQIEPITFPLKEGDNLLPKIPIPKVRKVVLQRNSPTLNERSPWPDGAAAGERAKHSLRSSNMRATDTSYALAMVLAGL
jgi:hypothetical protein